MKKFVVLLVVVALTCFSAAAFAADVTVGGSYEIRSRDFNDLNMDKDAAAAKAGDQRDTQNRIRLDVNVKAGDDVKGKFELESDFGSGDHDWGTLESYSTKGSNLGFREAWVSFNLPGIPVNVTGGHQLLALGNAWFLRNMHYGSDAWVVANQTGANTAAFVDIKVSEGNIYAADDVDAYALLDVFKINDANTAGIYLADVKAREGAVFGGEKTDLYNLGLHYTGSLSIVKLNAEIDAQGGKISNPGGDVKFKGNQIVVQGNVALDPVTVNFTLARGTGNKADDKDMKQIVTFLDIDPHYTFLYEYKIATAAGAKNTGFANTTAVGLGASMAATKSLTVGIDAWYLKATEDFKGIDGNNTDKIGTEIDAKINWKLYDNLAWNWNLGYFNPGDGFGKDAATGIQGVLAFKF